MSPTASMNDAGAFVIVMINKNSLGCKNGTAKQSRINATTEYDW